MPDTRRHRGPHPDDPRLFAADQIVPLRQATGDLCWLLNRDYALPSALKVVGDRYQLEARQRLAVQRCACTDRQHWRRFGRCTEPSALAGHRIVIDGLNLITTIEAALSGGVILVGRDGCYRDLASVHGTYRRVDETQPALEMIGRWLRDHDVAESHWLLDAPVSNSGRLRSLIESEAAAHGWNWTADVVRDPDQILATTTDLITTADSAILDRCEQWCGVATEIVQRDVPKAWIVDLFAS